MTTETKSGGFICALRNFTAASWARIRSSVSIDVRSKNITIMRRLRIWSATVSGGVRTGAGRRVIDWNDERLGVFRVGRFDRFNVGVREAGDFLVFAIVCDDELVCSQALDRLSIAASYFDIDADDVGLGAENGTRIQLIGPR